jgi:hypothetical protein
MGNIDPMIKSLVAAVALTIGLAGSAFAREAPPRHHNGHHSRHHHRRPKLQPEASPDALQPGPASDALNASIYWSPAGGNPIHYAQTTGFIGR